MFLDFNLHPVLTGLPLAFYGLLLLLEVLIWFKPLASWQSCRELILAVSTLSVFAAYFSGYQGVEFVSASDLQEHAAALAQHQLVGKIILYCAVSCAVFGFFRYKAQKNQSCFAAVYYLSLLMTFSLVAYTGYLGGRLVFQHGLAVNP